MIPGFAKSRRELPWLPYPESDKVYIINAHNFGGGASAPVLEFAEVFTISGSPSSVDVTIPAGTTSGDLLLVSIVKDSAASSISVPSGWTRIVQINNIETHDVFYRFADGSEGLSVTFNFTATEGGSYFVARVSGSSQIEATSNTTFDPPSITPSWGDSSFLVIAISTQRAPAGYTGFPIGYTQIGSSDVISIGTPETAAAWIEASGVSEDPSAFLGGGAASGAGSAVGVVTVAIGA